MCSRGRDAPESFFSLFAATNSNNFRQLPGNRQEMGGRRRGSSVEDGQLGQLAP